MSDLAESAPIFSPTSPLTGTATPSTTAYAASQLSAGMTTNGTPNAQSTVNGDTERSKSTSMSDPTFFALNLSSYLFNVGYLGSHWADIHLTFFDTGVNLHRIILARSPYLAHMMLNAPPHPTIELIFQDENISSEAIHIVIQHLYSPSQHLVNPTNARSVLATAFFFQGMPELVHHAYGICRDCLSSDSVIDYVQWLDSAPLIQANGHHGPSVSDTHDGMEIRMPPDEVPGWAEGKARYGEWSIRLKQDVLEYLVRTLPLSILESTASLVNDPVFISVYARLPFDLFTFCVGSPDLPLETVQARFNLAKKIIAQRKKLGNRGNMEEVVVLAIKGDKGEAAVHITRKPKRKSALWKVEG